MDFAPAATARGASFHRGNQLELVADGLEVRVRSLRDRTIRHFERLPGGRMALHAIRDPRGHAIRLVYEGDLLVEIVDTVGRRSA